VGATRLEVNSFHHQGLSSIGAGLEVVARAADGMAEALEVRGHPFALAVQYHPEEVDPADAASAAHFTAFVTACRERMAGRQPQGEPAPMGQGSLMGRD
jgi:gamma-glutamyl-gamma-aminobutyrate hydrolase PuuD